MLKATIVDWHRVMWELMKLEIDVKVVCKAFPLWHVSWGDEAGALGGIWPKACEDGGVKMKQDANDLGLKGARRRRNGDVCRLKT